jgi:hypothetical protein
LSTDKLARLRIEVSNLITDAGSSYTVTHYTEASTDTWGKVKSGANTTEKLFIVEKIEAEKLSREGQKDIEYYIILANYNSVLEVGDKVTIDSKDAWVRTIQPAHYKGEVFAKRITVIVEEWR